MKTINISELSQLNVEVRDLMVYPENWTKSHPYTRYRNAPRPNSGLFIICTDIQARYYQKGCSPIVAGKGDVIYIPMGVHYHAEVSGGVDNHIDSYTLNFHLSDENGEELLLADNICVITSREDDLLTMRTAALSDAFHRIGSANAPGHRSNLKIKAALYHLLDALAASAADRTEVYYPIRAGVEALRKEWNQNKKIEEYADLCEVGIAYFYRCFRQWSGKSPVEYRNEIRLSNAETMLRYTEMQVGEIARTVGFADPFYFCRIFAKVYGLPPRKYREAFFNSEDIAKHRNIQNL